MLHQIPEKELGPLAEPMTTAVQRCVHCGFCLPACPTYELLREEMDSPRGRIFLMKEVLEGNVELDDAMPYLDRCLGCVGCVTACPSGVQYGELITPFRAHAEPRRRRTVAQRIVRWLMLATLPYPGRFRLAARLGGWARPLRKLFPGQMGSMLELLPPLRKPQPLPQLHPAEGRRRGRVALLAGCAQQAIAPNINWAALRVLSANGVEVVIPRQQVCCGALGAHTGAMQQARRFARINLRAFPEDVDAVLTTAAGCGSGMHEYGLWLRGEPEQEAAERLAGRSQDVSVYLANLGMVEPPPLASPLKVAYHDACHLAHAQRVTSQPRQLLRQVGNLEIAEVPEGEMCCGSAGTYNIEQPELARQLGEKKAAAIASTGASAVATGNIGCMTQIQMHLVQRGAPLPVYHALELLDFAYRREAPHPI